MCFLYWFQASEWWIKVLWKHFINSCSHFYLFFSCYILVALLGVHWHAIWVLLSLSNLLIDECDESLWSSLVLFVFGAFRGEGMKMYIRKMRSECGIHLGHLAERKCQSGTAGWSSPIRSSVCQKITFFKLHGECPMFELLNMQFFLRKEERKNMFLPFLSLT